MNVKKIKHALNCCVTNECDICAYAEKMICFNTLLQDACTAIEEQEERISIMQESMEALEKRNEPIEPIKPEELWICGACCEGIVGWDDWIIGDTRHNYCPNCGQAVRWND